jgi:malate dehydrogenase (oxaloacetate-decarboxylating)
LRIVEKDMKDIRIVMYGAGASNATIARLILQAGGDPEKMILFDSKGALSKDRDDIKADKRFYRKWELCEQTNPDRINDIEKAMKGADVLIALSKPGPDVVKPEWIRSMGDKPIVFACANPVPEIYPYAAKEAGAYITATGRGDFPNQVNNSLGFPGILKGALLVRSRSVTDNMAVAASYSMANYAEKKGINPDYIMPKMDETDMFAFEAADVAMQAVKDGVARVESDWDTIYNRTLEDIGQTRQTIDAMMDKNLIKKPDTSLLEQALNKAIEQVK